MVYISLSVSSKDKIEDAVGELARLGFLNIELGGGKEFSARVAFGLLSLKKRYGINFLIHNYFPPPKQDFVMNIASQDKFVRESTFKLIKNVVRLTRKLKLNLYTLHSGYNKSSLYEKGGRFYEEENYGEKQERRNTKEDFYRGIDFLLGHIIKNNLKVGIENLFPLNKSVHSFLECPGDIIDFLKFYKEEPHIGLLLDLGHLNIASSYLGFDKFLTVETIFRDFADKIFEIHISENDGSDDGHEISGLDSWQVELVRRNKKILSNIPVVFEWRNVANSQIHQHFQALKRFLAG